MNEDRTKKDETYSQGYAKSDQRREQNDPRSYKCNQPQGLIETKKPKRDPEIEGKSDCPCAFVSLPCKP